MSAGPWRKKQHADGLTRCECGRVALKRRRSGDVMGDRCAALQSAGFTGGPEGVNVTAGRRAPRAETIEEIYRALRTHPATKNL